MCGRRCCALSVTSHRTRENIYRCSRYMASGNKSTIFIFKWRVFEEKGSVQRHPDSSRLESLGGSSRVESRCELGSSPRVRGCLEPAREQN